MGWEPWFSGNKLTFPPALQYLVDLSLIFLNGFAVAPINQIKPALNLASPVEVRQFDPYHAGGFPWQEARQANCHGTAAGRDRRGSRETGVNLGLSLGDSEPLLVGLKV